MKFCCICGTNRQNSKTLAVSKYILGLFSSNECSFIDLAQTDLLKITRFYQDSSKIKKELDKIHQSKGVVLVIPEYNSSYPGIFKYFVDHWDEERTFDRVFYLAGIGGSLTSGSLALRDVRSILLSQGGLVYSQYTCIPEKSINAKLKKITQKGIAQRLKDQVEGFQLFVQKLT